MVVHIQVRVLIVMEDQEVLVVEGIDPQAQELLFSLLNQVTQAHMDLVIMVVLDLLLQVVVEVALVLLVVMDLLLKLEGLVKHILSQMVQLQFTTLVVAVVDNTEETLVRVDKEVVLHQIVVRL